MLVKHIFSESLILIRDIDTTLLCFNNLGNRKMDLLLKLVVG